MADGDSRKRLRTETPEFQRRVSAASLSAIVNPDPDISFLPSPSFHSPPVIHSEPRPLSPGRLEQNVFGARPAEDIVRVVADFIYTHLKDRSNIEIEGKLGRIVDKNSGQRINLPVVSETALSDDKAIRFESNMTLQQHATFNRLLNQRVDETRRPEFRGSRIEYSHTKEIDHFYKLDGTRIRVTTDKESGQVIAVITKTKIADLNIYSPRTKLDIRISINEEKTLEKPDTDAIKPLLERHKDRLSYKQDLWSFDLTQVISPEQERGPVNPYALGPPKTTPAVTTHELELEVARPEVWLAERAKVAANKPNSFHEITHIFLGNLRALAKRAI
ncbi:mRNA-capping enzyme subunit beta [Coemansia spiralis]|uniref:mRNA-capping enzyme subunit beta n=2 Tax=Coemansia TaxID=4863 RepID=A0A9W8GBT5_9FUNG|nr:CYTH-like domain-containing protein [Coemansia spiralis]KAJ1996264.1 mRNA-capping enzyme subunit beta [Coemansia umbellata]KAJ2625978.1 mRNA-capping enzyme subunit beta [Coemansia sp. RSA 1358]KAJ2680692.1 mRNA-capping enzyme subunit beta [Coemansia spiralis]